MISPPKDTPDDYDSFKGEESFNESPRKPPMKRLHWVGRPSQPMSRGSRCFAASARNIVDPEEPNNRRGCNSVVMFKGGADNSAVNDDGEVSKRSLV